MKRTNGSWKKGFATLGIVTLLVVALVGCEGGGLQQAASETADVSSDAPEQTTVDISALQQKLDDLLSQQQEAAANRAAERAALEKEIADLRVLLDASPAEVWVGTDGDDFYEEAAPDDNPPPEASGQSSYRQFERMPSLFPNRGDYLHILDVMQRQNADQANTSIPQEQDLRETRTQEFGTPIGTRGEVKCDSGSVISALDLNAGGVIDSIRFLCSPVLQLNDKGSATLKGSSFGGEGVGQRVNGNLGPFSGAALNGMMVKICSYQSEAVIAELLPFFTRMTDNDSSNEDEANMNVFDASHPDQPAKGNPHGMGAYSTHNKSCSGWQQIVCPEDQVATGAVVHAGSFVDSLQLICQDQNALIDHARQQPAQQ